MQFVPVRPPGQKTSLQLIVIDNDPPMALEAVVFYKTDCTRIFFRSGSNLVVVGSLGEIARRFMEPLSTPEDLVEYFLKNPDAATEP